MINKAFVKNFDWILFSVLCIILTVGLVFVRSAASEKFMFKQMLWVAMGFILFFILFYVDYLSFARHAYIIYTSMIFLLILILCIGGSVNGSRRWFIIGPFSLQPSEFMKITLVLALARFLRFKENRLGLYDIVISVLLTGIPMILIMMQPDLGTALVMVPVLFSILFVSGVKLRYLFGIIGTGGIIAPLLWLFVLKSYQKMRIIGFLWPEKAIDWGAGYHRLQSLIAVGSGGLFGAGLGNGTQNRLRFLPERHTDFIFAVLAEEWGFLRACLVFLLYIALIACGIGIAQNTRESYGRMVVTGFVTIYATQILVNIGMTLGVAPIVGITLPFISYGGSSILASFIALSIIFNVKMRSKVDLSSKRF